MDAEGWNCRYATSELIWTAEPSRFLVDEVAGLAPGGLQDPAVLFSAADVVADLDGTGLTARRAEAVQRTATTDDGERTAIDALIRAERVA